MRDQAGSSTHTTIIASLGILAVVLLTLLWIQKGDSDQTPENQNTATQTAQNANTNVAVITTTIASYTDCVNAGFPILKTDPLSCEAGGVTFTLDATGLTDLITGVTDERVIYNARNHTKEEMQTDCAGRDGTFNECHMPPCPSGACMQVCGYACELP